MVKTLLTPTKSEISLHIPSKYVGKQIEILFYATDELTEEKGSNKSKLTSLKGLLSSKEADDFNIYLGKARKEWRKGI